MSRLHSVIYTRPAGGLSFNNIVLCPTETETRDVQKHLARGRRLTFSEPEYGMYSLSQWEDLLESKFT